jgi:alkaline phosphatase D
VWDDHEVENDYAGLEGAPAETDFAARRAAAYQAYWEHQPFPKHWRPRGPEMRIYHRTAWGRLAQIHAVDDRQYRDPHLCGGGTVPRAGCPALDDPRRSMLGAAQERWLAEGWDASRPWNLLAQQTLMAPVRWSTDRSTERVWTDGWEGYGPARARLLDALNQRRVPNAVVLGGDVHTNYVADLHADLADPASPIVASEFCGTSVTSWAGIAQERLDAMRPLNPHLHHVRADERGYVRFTLDAQRLQAELRVVDDVMDPASAIRTSAAFVVEAGRPGVQPA